MVKLALVIGQGEVGNPLFEMLADAYDPDQIFFRDIEDPEWAHKFKFLHICYPQNVDWKDSIVKYLMQYDPEAVIIHSTVHLGTTEDLNQSLKPIFYYSPVRGNVKDGMRWCLKNYTKYISGPRHAELRTLDLHKDNTYPSVMEHMKKAGFKIKYVPDSGCLEYAKTLDLAWYGLNIAFYQELERIIYPSVKKYEVIREFIESTPIESEGKVQRSVFYGGFIGGHCVIPAIEKLLAKHDIPMLEAVIKSNIKREKEMILSPEMLLGEKETK